MRHKYLCFTLIIMFIPFLVIFYEFILFFKEKAQIIDLSIFKSQNLKNKACKNLRNYFHLPDNDCEETCIESNYSGRFGNQIIIFLRMIQVAKLTNIKTVYFRNGFLLQDKSFNVEGINFLLKSSKNSEKCFKHTFFLPYPDYPRLSFKISQDFRTIFMRSIPKIFIPNDTLVIHLRSGDIFNGNKYDWYGQPPCNYYLDTLNFKNWSQIFIISEDKRNHCIKILEEKTGSTFHKNNFKKDLSILLNAKNLVLSTSTLSYAIILLSQKLQNLFMFNISSTRISNHMNCVPTDDYYNLVKVWKNDNDHIQQMLHSHCSRWEYVEKGSKDLDSFLHSVFL